MKTALAVMVLAAAAMACSPEDVPSDLDPNWPAVEQYFRLESGSPVCDGPRQHIVSNDGNSITCTWDKVTVEGEPTCLAVVVFERTNAEAPWEQPTVFVTHATICPSDQDAL